MSAREAAPGPSLSVAEERALLAAARRGGRVEVGALVRYLTPHIQKRAAFEVLRRSRGPRPVRREVEDLVHEVWARLFEADWKILRAWDPDRGMCLRAFVRLVTSRLVVDMQRSGRRTPFLERPVATEALEAAPEGRELARRIEARDLLGRLAQALKARLTPAAHDVFEVMYLEGAEVDETTRRTGLTKSSVYSHRKRIAKAVLEVRGELVRE